MTEVVEYFEGIRDRTMREGNAMLNVPAPPIYGLTEEQVKERRVSGMPAAAGERLVP